MADRKKVIKGMEYCINYAQRVKDLINDVPCEGCPYVTLKSNAVGQGDCIDSLFEDALALLKAQEPIAPIQGADDQDEDIFCCGCCGAVVGETFLGPPGETEVRDNYCPNCGRKVKWE